MVSAPLGNRRSTHRGIPRLRRERRPALAHRRRRYKDRHGLSNDIQRRALSRNGEPVKLTKAEYELLVALSSYPNQVLSRERILNMISHRVDAPNDRTIDVLIRRMRAKMEFDPKNPQIFVTVHGEGYMFAGD